METNEKLETAVAKKSPQELQQVYVERLIRANPGLGDGAVEIARDLVNTGMTYNEALSLINTVYAPRTVEGRGQSTRAKHFSKAVIARYGDDRLAKCSTSVPLFRGLVAQIGEAVAMRDEVNETLYQTSISFADTLAFQEAGFSPEQIVDCIGKLVSESNYHISESGAVMKIKQAVKKLENHEFANLEGILFPGEDNPPEELTRDEKLERGAYASVDRYHQIREQ